MPMTTDAKRESNRRNARRSTGPRTDGGKSAARLNAVVHGLRSALPVVPGERAEDWDAHRAGVAAALAPVGTLEAELAERVALLTWRMRRVTRYETAATASGIRTAVARVRGEPDDDPLRALLASQLHGEFTPNTYASVRDQLADARGCAKGFARIRDGLRQLPGLPDEHRLHGGDALSLLREVGSYQPDGEAEEIEVEDPGFLASVGVPEEWGEYSDWWDGWTASVVRAGVRVIAAVRGVTPDALIEGAAREADRTAAAEGRKAVRLEFLFAHMKSEIAAPERAARGRALLPGGDVLDKVMRYESHLGRQLTQTLHQLERLQATRSGKPLSTISPPPRLGASPHRRRADTAAFRARSGLPSGVDLRS